MEVRFEYLPAVGLLLIAPSAPEFPALTSVLRKRLAPEDEPLLDDPEPGSAILLNGNPVPISAMSVV